jgi:hypothetical protein
MAMHPLSQTFARKGWRGPRPSLTRSPLPNVSAISAWKWHALSRPEDLRSSPE